MTTTAADGVELDHDEPYIRVRELEADLKAVVDGEVRFDAGSRGAYSTDSSNYRQVPFGVVVPRTVEAGIQAVEVCRRHRAPVTSRGGGTSLAGQSCNVAVIVDWSKYCNRLLSVDAKSGTCVVEPGIVLDDLNDQLSEHGLMFGPRPATHDHCTLGGMIGNNSCGSTAQAYGKTVDNVLRLEVLTYEGEQRWVGPTSDEELADLVGQEGRWGHIYTQLRDLIAAGADQVRRRFPDIPRRVSGYNLDALLPENGFDVAQLLIGSEGTLVTVLRAELRLVPVPAAASLVVLGYPDISTAAESVPKILTHQPHQLEGVDERLMSLERNAEEHQDALDKLPEGSGWLLVSFVGDDQQEADARAHALIDELRDEEQPPSSAFFDDPDLQAELWKVREGGLGATAHAKGMPDTWPGWEDSAVEPARLGPYLRALNKLFDKHGYEGPALYGHFGQGCVHTRIPFDLVTPSGVQNFRTFVEEAADLVVAYNGSLSGEHGDGQARAELLPRMFGREVVEAFQQLKEIFDPDDRMNPGKVVGVSSLDSDLRLGSHWAPRQLQTRFDYPDDDGRFDRAVMRCVGVGTCRRPQGGVMCPSYMVTREEEHSTRGRARLLFEMLQGHEDSAIDDGWRSAEVKDALDLCLACKGCKRDCPVGVDMATYKAEFLHHHYAGRLRPMSHYSMGWLPVAAKLASAAPRTVNALTHSRPIAAAAKRVAGIAEERQIPWFAGSTLQQWFGGRAPVTGARGQVLLWPDTFTNHFDPDIGRAAVALLENAGYQVRMPTQPVCCGLTWISTGQLGIAERVLRRTLRLLAPELRNGTPIVGLEPSCTAVFRSDATELMSGNRDADRLRQQTVTLAELLNRHTDGWDPPQIHGQALVQTHCHQHAVLGFDDDESLMKRAGIEADVLDSGCCGLAGNFGFESGHYQVSRAAGERVLLPAVREAGPTTQILADGFSCRTQIDQGGTKRKPRHLAQVLADGLVTRNE